MGRRIHAWFPPGHNDEHGSAADSDLVSLIDGQDPAFQYIARTLLDLRALKVEITPDLVRRVVERGRRAHELAVAREMYRLQFAPTPQAVEAVASSVVYYMRIGNRVKIGFSTKVTERLKVINPEELLAFEPGGLALERARHAEFDALRVNGEWFKYEEPLTGHVKKLQATMGAAT